MLVSLRKQHLRLQLQHRAAVASERDVRASADEGTYARRRPEEGHGRRLPSLTRAAARQIVRRSSSAATRNRPSRCSRQSDHPSTLPGTAPSFSIPVVLSQNLMLPSSLLLATRSWPANATRVTRPLCAN